MGFDSGASTHVENIDLLDLSKAFYNFQKDFDVPPEILVDVEKSKIHSLITNCYAAHSVQIRQNKLTFNAELFDLAFKVVISELLMEKAEDFHKSLNKFGLQTVYLITYYNKLKTGYSKSRKELYKCIRNLKHIDPSQ